MNPTALLIGEAIAVTVRAVLEAFAKQGVSEEDLEEGKQKGLGEIGDIKADELTEHAYQWRLARGEEVTRP